MTAPLPFTAAHRRFPLGSAKAAAHPEEFREQVDARASLIERACLISDVTEALGSLALPEDMTVICAAFRSGYPDALGPVLVRMLRREWRELADVEITRELNDVERGVAAPDAIPSYVLAREVAIAQMGGCHG
ncbi:hypothetical protein [Pandoraea apista]|uniref:hypothetical protein n=1 Tax=Pandoraea apista TaxID=93218 RepID=UPI000658B453|nr:hypothetical protein [Pandoraea apista]ALS63599.1 hypothetical protein AT395_00065 [Pandoraea apista]CFB63126.1 hypothetical protein LMG16407_03201 [Pandoraea apista]